jgi:hypothetical protein
MTRTVHSVKLIPYAGVDLDRVAYSNGDIVYDNTDKTIRVMDGSIAGGYKIATRRWTTTSITTAVSASAATLNAAIALKSPLASPTFTGIVTSPAFSGPLTGNVTGNLTGNVTGNLTGNVTGNVSGSSGSTTGNAATATKLAATKNINSVAFDGSANISVNTLVNGSYTITLNSSGNLTVPGNITSSTGTITANQITSTTSISANSLSITGNITAGSNVVISTTPTAKTHATNKQYVDTRALALSIALGG